MKKKLLIGLAAILVLVIGAGVVAFFVLDPKAMVAKKKDEVLADLSTKLGRQVTAGDVTASVGSQLKARIVNIQMAGPPVAEGQPPKPAQMQIGSVDMRFSLVRALFSFGQDLYVE